MKNFIHLIYIISILVLYVSQATQAQNTRYRIYGHISDSITNESLPYISVRIKNSSNGCSSDNNGFFFFISSTLKDTLIVSSIGYKEKQIILTARTKFPLKVQLAPEMYELSEITIKPKKEKYSKKNNPAVELARKLIARREENSPKNKPFYSRDRHEKRRRATLEKNSHSSTNTSTRRSFRESPYYTFRRANFWPQTITENLHAAKDSM